jgi:cell wall-associated NlpC family hydrolase
MSNYTKEKWKVMKRKDLFFNYALSFLGLPYKWGGNTRFEGMDCSGLVCELFTAFGITKGDNNAQGLLKSIESRKWADSFLRSPHKHHPGSILFFGRDFDQISHVAITMTESQMIEAGGGDSTTIDLTTAKNQNACVRIRPITFRRDFICGYKIPLED